MRAGAKAGKLVDADPSSSGQAGMDTWGQERTVRAVVLRHLLIDNDWPVDARGVVLHGVRVSGFLDMKGATLRCALCLNSCYLDASEPVCFDHATASLIELIKCQMPGLTGDMFTAKEINLSGSTSTGPLLLRSANIVGQFVCRAASLIGSDDDGNALIADEIKVGSVFLDRGFSTEGAVRLHSASVGGQVCCSGAKLNGCDNDGDALIADGIRTGGNLFLDDGFTAAGGVRLLGADIGGQLNCQGSSLNSRSDHADALFAKGMRAGGDLYFDEGFTTSGAIVLRSARIGGSINFAPVSPVTGVTTLDASHAQIIGTLNWIPQQQVAGQVNLQGTVVHQLQDDWGSGRDNGFWPVGGRLRLSNFTYAGFGGDHQATADQRLAWIRSQYMQLADNSTEGFSTQPYEQLVAVYRQDGQDTEARKVAIARRADLRKYGNLTWYRIVGNWLLDKTIKYGYQAWRAGAALAVLFVAAWVLSAVAQQLHLIVPVGDIQGLKFVPSANECTASYPCFFPAGYAVDTVIPIINVHQAQYWAPDGHAPWGWAWVAGTWIATGLGWALATLLVAGYTGLVRQD